MMAFRGTRRNTIYAATVAAVVIIIMGAVVDGTGSRGAGGLALHPSPHPLSSHHPRPTPR